MNTATWRGLGLAAALGWGAPAAALQPLAEFVAAADRAHPHLREADANAESAAAQATASLGRSLPSVALRGSYTRNQYNVVLPLPPSGKLLTISPSNQLGATGTLTVPLVDIANYARVAAARTGLGATHAQAAAARLQVRAEVTQAYYQLVAEVAVVASAERALSVAEASLALTRDRLDAGTAATLEADRAEAERQQQLQTLAQARLQRTLGARQLASLCGLVPELDVGDATVPLADDLHPEPAVDPDDAAIPTIRAARGTAASLATLATAQKLAWLPTVSGAFVENLTNAPSFVGRDHYWAASVTASWNLDVAVFAQIGQTAADAAAAAARAEQSRRDGRDAVYRYRETIVADIARSRAAREQLRVSAEAARLAAERYAAGTTTQLELLQAQRDAFAADIGRIQADADLVNARAQLRYAAGSLTPP